eukprot:TRINITY_DN1690_c0_g1_i5.p1 TRINITY_DN1690_c0_g1~~TRINITY_DN1690_c0_g1_i5.p1  ORF type:complete len:768 (-),score=311.01 TRINITY_DN1690_c0_g1_i5:181-2484(-)
MFREYAAYGVKFDDVRAGLIIGVYALPMLLGALAMLSGFCNLHRLSLCVGLCCFLASWMLWVSFAVHLPLSLLLFDGCDEAARYLADSNDDNSGYPSFLGCTNGTVAPLAGLKNDAESGLNQAFDQICSYARKGCNMTDYCSATCSRANAATFKDSIIEDVGVGCRVGPGGTGPFVCPVADLNTCTTTPVKCPIQNVTWDNCTRVCHEPELRNASAQILDNLRIALLYEALLDDDVLPIISCAFVGGIISSLDDAVCTKMSNGIDGIATSTMIVACFLAPFTFLTIIGFKRFRKQRTKAADEPDADDVELQPPTRKLVVANFRFMAPSAQLLVCGTFNNWATSGPDAVLMQARTENGVQVHYASVDVSPGRYDYKYYDPRDGRWLMDPTALCVGDLNFVLVTSDAASAQGSAKPAAGNEAPLSPRPLDTATVSADVPPNTAADAQQPPSQAAYAPPAGQPPLYPQLFVPAVASGYVPPGAYAAAFVSQAPLSPRPPEAAALFAAGPTADTYSSQPPPSFDEAIATTSPPPSYTSYVAAQADFAEQQQLADPSATSPTAAAYAAPSPGGGMFTPAPSSGVATLRPSTSAAVLLSEPPKNALYALDDPPPDYNQVSSTEFEVASAAALPLVSPHDSDKPFADRGFVHSESESQARQLEHQMSDPPAYEDIYAAAAASQAASPPVVGSPPAYLVDIFLNSAVAANSASPAGSAPASVHAAPQPYGQYGQYGQTDQPGDRTSLSADLAAWDALLAGEESANPAEDNQHNRI